MLLQTCWWRCVSVRDSLKIDRGTIMAKKYIGRAIIYLRRSTKGQEKSLRQQLDWATKRARELQVQLKVTVQSLDGAVKADESYRGDLYLDDAVSGSDMGRVGFQAFVDRALRDRSITHVLCWMRNRFGRPDDPSQAIGLENRIRKAGKTIVLVDTILPPLGLNDYDIGQSVAGLVAYDQARQDLLTISRNVTRARKENGELGVSGGGRPPYGFVRAVVEMGRLQVVDVLRRGKPMGKFRGHKVAFLPGDHPACSDFRKANEIVQSRRELDAVRLIHREYYKGRGVTAIAGLLNERGIAPPTPGKPCKKKAWISSAVKGVIENPLYMGKVASGRYSEGKYSRVDWSREVEYRDVDEAEVYIDEGKRKGKVVVHRDARSWKMVDPPVPFDPMIPPDIWWANIDRLKTNGEVGGLRGLSRRRNPNGYPLDVFCGDCGKPMVGSPYKGESCYICSTYTKSQGTLCHHNWVERDVLVWYTVHRLRELIESSKKTTALRGSIRDALQRSLSDKDGVQASLKKLRREIASLHDQAKRTYQDKMHAAEPVTRKIAGEVYADMLSDIKSREREVRSLEATKRMTSLDVDVESKRALAVLGQLHLFLEKVGDSQLRETFTALGIQVTISFDHPKKGRRRNIPCGGKILVGSGGKIEMPMEVGETADVDTISTQNRGLDNDGGGGQIRTAA